MARFALGPQKMQSPSVDVSSGQTITGPKTFTDTVFLAKAAQAATAEELLRGTVSDDAAARWTLLNGDTTNGVFVPVLSWLGTTAGTGFTAGQLRFRLGAGMDSGTTPIAAYFYQTSAGGSPATRPLRGEYSGSTLVQSLGAFGNITATIIAQAGVAEELGRWELSDAPLKGIRFLNENASAAECLPTIRLLPSSNLGSLIQSVATSDTGANYGMTLASAGPAGVVLATRSPFQFLNGPNQIADFTPGGSFRLTAANQGLHLKAGTRARRVTMSGGTVTIADTSVTVNTLCLSLVRTTKSGTLGHVDIAFTAGVGYTVTSTSGTEASTFDLVLAEIIP